VSFTRRKFSLFCRSRFYSVNQWSGSESERIRIVGWIRIRKKVRIWIRTRHCCKIKFFVKKSHIKHLKEKKPYVLQLENFFLSRTDSRTHVKAMRGTIKKNSVKNSGSIRIRIRNRIKKIVLIRIRKKRNSNPQHWCQQHFCNRTCQLPSKYLGDAMCKTVSIR
jgi:hypothetical protein